MAGPRVFLDFAEARQAARARLPRAIFDYIDRGTEAETALAGLRSAFDRRRVVQRALRDVTRLDTGTELFGERRADPILVAPTALAGLVRFNGEVGSARGAGRAGMPYCAATQASLRVEEIAAGAAGTELWFQLYPWRDEAETEALLARAAALGIATLLVTVDTPASPKKVHNRRNGFAIPLAPSLRLGLDLALHPRWTLGVIGRYWADRGIPSYDNYPGAVRRAITRAISDPRFALATDFGPDAVARLRERWRGRFVVKGLQHPEDAERALALGADGIVVSAHGGRNLDSLAHPLHVLPEIRRAVGGKLSILADSGVRRGSDIAKLVGAGADAVLCGRAFLYGYAAEGETGMVRMAEILREELRAFMAFSGLRDVAELRAARWTDEP